MLDWSSRTVSERIAAATPLIEPVLAKYDSSSDTSQIKRLSDLALNILSDYSLSYCQKISPDSVGVHSTNRWGSGLVPAEVHTNIANILGIGFSLPACADATVTETPPGQEGQQQVAFNETLVKDSSGLLAEIKPDSLKYLSLCCGHTNAGLRAAKAECRSELDNRFTENGFLNRRKIEELDQCYGAAMQEGIRWRVLKHEVLTKWPSLSYLLQEAGNVTNHVAQEESVLQVLMKLRKMGLKTIDDVGSIDWDRLGAAVTRNNTLCKDRVPDLVSFIKAWGGSDPKESILEQVDRANRLLTFKRHVPPSCFGRLARIQLGAMLPSLYIGACLKAMYACPGKYESEGEAKLLTNTDIMSISNKNKAFVVQAHSIMEEARSVLKQSKLAPDSPEAIKLLSDLDIRLVMHVHQKIAPSRKGFSLLGDIALAFWEELVKIHGPMSCPCPWHKSCGGGGPTKALTVEPPSSGIRDLSSGAMSSAHLEGLGVKKDGHMICKSDSLRYIIQTIDSTNFKVHLALASSNKKKHSLVVDFTEIFEKYEVAKDTAQDFRVCVCVCVCVWGA